MRAASSLIAAAAAVLAAAPAAPALARTPASDAQVGSSALLSSRDLWATIDVCNPGDQRNTVGVRGSMPGDGRARDRMYMSFRLQYMNATSKHWADLAGASSAQIAVGSGSSARQGGRSFQLAPLKAPAMLRGVIEFQWRRGSALVLAVSRPTTAGHHSLAGADPPDYSAATCQMG